jgi:antitoxin (DNA-binding transcriptional repressor) of toxin-antitoxin stability system
MAAIINIPETTAQFTELIQRAQAGEEILLAQNGIAIARLMPIQASLASRVPGQDKDKDKVVLAPDFNAPLPDYILNDFLGTHSSTL